MEFIDTKKVLPLFQGDDDCSCQGISKRVHKKAILVTGASGFIGKYFLEAFKEDYHIYALARRCQQAAGVPPHPNIQWFCGDLGDEQAVRRITDAIAAEGGVDFIFHFAGYYDFTNQENPEYERTNVQGTRNLLENAAKLNLKRFIFSSSLTVTEYRYNDRLITEASPLDAEIPYARSKREAEELIKDYSRFFPCTIVRLAAVYSDWGEYGPLYVLLKSWLSKGLLARIVAGQGKTGLPYLHIADLVSLFKRIILKHGELSSLEIVLASPDESVSHNELYDLVSRYRGKTRKSVKMPLWLAAIGVFLKNLTGKWIHRPSFEQLWMLKYVDKKMKTDASMTRELLDWSPKNRYLIGRRLFFLIDNIVANPTEWEKRNGIMAFKAIDKTPNSRMYEVMMAEGDNIIADHIGFLTSPENRNRFPHYQELTSEALKLRANFSFEILSLAVLNKDRHHIRFFARQLARQRYQEGVELDELSGALHHTVAITAKNLALNPVLKDLDNLINSEFNIISQLIADEIEEVFDMSADQKPLNSTVKNSEKTNKTTMQLDA